MSISLQGKTVLVTRERKQAKEFAEKIVNAGGKPVVVPLLKIECQKHPRSDHIFKQLEYYDWLFFTSSNGVECFLKLSKEYGIHVNDLATKKIAAVGHKTERTLKRYDLKADFIPTIYDADHMAKEFLMNIQTDHQKLLLIRGTRSLATLSKEFSKKEILFDELEVYRSGYNNDSRQSLLYALNKYKFDFLTFTSPSTVEAYSETVNSSSILPENLQATCVCIGTTTEKYAKNLGFKQIITPEEFTIDQMIVTMSDYLRKDW